MQDVYIRTHPQHRPGKARPYVARWRVGIDGPAKGWHSASFDAETRAIGHLAKLRDAKSAGQHFDEVTGLPDSMAPAAPAPAGAEPALTLLGQAQAHVRAQWQGWAPKSRRNAVQSLLGSICALTDAPMPDKYIKPSSTKTKAGRAATTPPPAWSWLQNVWLRPGAEPYMVRARDSQGKWIREEDGTWAMVPYAASASELEAAAWLSAHSLALTAIKAAHVERALTVAGASLAGEALMPESQSRVRTNLSHLLRVAARDDLIPANPATLVDRDKLPRTQAIDKRATADLAQALAMAASVRVRAKRQGELYYVWLLMIILAGIRPPELALMHRQHLDLPETGWGEARVYGMGTMAGTAWSGTGKAYSESARQKRREEGTPARSVPLPPELVAVLRAFIAARKIGPTARVFGVQGGGVLTGENKGLCRAWWAARAELHPAVRDAKGNIAPAWMQTDPLYELTPYDLRHTAASTMISGDVPVAEIARRMGHDLRELLTTYAGFFTEDLKAGNAAMDSYYSTTGLAGLLGLPKV